MTPQAAPESPPLLDSLRRAGLVTGSAATLEPLTGGVSSDIVKVVDGSRTLVVKRALPQLRVASEWHADIGRNAVEYAYLMAVGKWMPGAVPRVLGANLAEGWFAMEFVGPPFENWKSRLLAGAIDPELARAAGTLLGTIHRSTWGQADVAREFATWPNFYQLRAHPYLETSAVRVPELAPYLRAEVERLQHTALALVHGDYSPKNLLVASGRLLAVDAEVAWFGEPAFDAAFLVTHFFLKARLRPDRAAAFLGLAREFWGSYGLALGEHRTGDLEARVVRLVLCLLLARVHGKSPVEYLTEEAARRFVTDFVRHHLPRPPPTLAGLSQAWLEGLCPP